MGKRACHNISRRVTIVKMQIVLALIIALGITLRFYHLDLSPGGLYADEASIGYNAYSIYTSGRDEHGISSPLFFKAFGEYKNPVFIYSLVPLIAVFGLTPWTVRAGAAVWGSLALPLMYIFSFQLTKNKPLSLLATLILALMPWHLHYSRLGFEAITLPTLFLFALVSYFKNRPLLSGLTFGSSPGPSSLCLAAALSAAEVPKGLTLRPKRWASGSIEIT